MTKISSLGVAALARAISRRATMAETAGSAAMATMAATAAMATKACNDGEGRGGSD